MRLHVVGLPHTRFSDDYSWCAYTTKVARFARMMTEGAGIETITYGNGPAELPGKYVMVTDETPEPFFIPEFEPMNKWFVKFNALVTARIYEHLEADDLICLIGGTAQVQIANNLAHIPIVEFGIGYEGVFAKFKVFESYTWQHFVYGMRHEGGSPWDTVIYNYFDPDQFHTGKDGGYFAFMGRVCGVKGVDTAVACCRAAGVRLKIAGHVWDDAGWVEELEGDVEYVGELGAEARADFLANATALIAPTRYVEPFGGVHVEAMFSGVPVIVPDWGAFTEFVTPEAMNGIRCRSHRDYVDALSVAPSLRRPALREQAEWNFSMWNIATEYAEYFERVSKCR